MESSYNSLWKWLLILVGNWVKITCSKLWNQYTTSDWEHYQCLYIFWCCKGWGGIYLWCHWPWKRKHFFFSFCRTVLSCWASFLLFISVCVYFEEVSWDNVQTQSNHVKTWTGSCHNTSSNSVVASDGNKLESTYWQRHRELCDLIPLQPYHPPHSPPDQTGSGLQAIMNYTAFVVPGMFFYGLEGCILSLNC